MARVEDMFQKMKMRFNASDEHVLELRGDFTKIGENVDAHAISIKYLELQMAQLSSTANQPQVDTLSRNTSRIPNMMDIVW